MRTFKAHYTQCSIERIVKAMEENPGGDNIVQVWKDYIIEDANIVIEKAVKVIKLETVNSCGRKLQCVVQDFTDF